MMAESERDTPRKPVMAERADREFKFCESVLCISH